MDGEGLPGDVCLPGFLLALDCRLANLSGDEYTLIYISRRDRRAEKEGRERKANVCRTSILLQYSVVARASRKLFVYLRQGTAFDADLNCSELARQPCS